jgi:hypothetical protein
MSKGVVQFNFVDDGGMYVCSGSMINTQNSSFAPYLLTAHHCISSDAEARSMEARFFYQTSACNGLPPSRAGVPSITGARYLAGAPYSEGDYALVLLNGPAPAGAWFLGWTLAGVNIGNATLGIHHPAGSWKRISFGTRTKDQSVTVGGEAAPANLYYRVSWTQGKTEGGSSGSPLLNDQGQILGTLTYGPIVPPGSSVCDLNPQTAGYGRFANAYPAIRAYLEDTPAPSLTVTPSSLAFTVNNGQYTGSSQQTLTIRTQSTAALPYSLTASAPWIRLSSLSGNVSADAPASVSVSLDLSYFSASTSTTGTVSASSGTLTPISVSVQANVTITRSKVLATVTPNPVYQQATDADGYAWFYTVRLTETGGVAARLTSLKYEGGDLSNNIVSWFGSDLLPAHGALSSALRNRAEPVPVTRLFEVAGVDIATGLAWATQVTVSFLPRPTKAILVLDSYPNLIRQDPNSTACPWYQQLVLQETGGFGVTLNRFMAAGYDLSSQIADFWEDTRLLASGSLLGRLCWPAVQAPTTLDMEVGGIDSNGSTVSASVRASFSGPAAYPTTMFASTTSVNLNALAGSASPVARTISLSIGSSTATWTGRLVFRDAPNTWLTVWPLSGTGSATLNLSALPAGLSSGTHEATLLLQSTDAIPQPEYPREAEHHAGQPIHSIRAWERQLSARHFLGVLVLCFRRQPRPDHAPVAGIRLRRK